MDSKTFIKNRLVSLISKYNNIFIEYYFHRFDNDHFLVITPESVRDEIVEKIAVDFDIDFVNNFPNESLTFFHPDEDEYDLGELIFSNIPTFDTVLYKKVRNVKVYNAVNDYTIFRKDEFSLPKEKRKELEEIIKEYAPIAGNEEFALAA